MSTPLPPIPQQPCQTAAQKETAQRKGNQKKSAPKADKPPAPPSDGPEAAEAVLNEYAGEDREVRERLREFCEDRKRRKKPLQTQRAAKVLVHRLESYSGGDRASKLAMLDNAILHGWDSVYPLKDDEKPGTAQTGGTSGDPLWGEGVQYI